MARITITDDGGPIRGRLAVHVGPVQNGERFAHIRIGELLIEVKGTDDAAAERCQAIAAQFHKLALELLRPPLSREDRLRARELERDERRQIREAVRAARLPAEYAEDLIRNGIGLLDAQRLVFEELRGRAGELLEGSRPVMSCDAPIIRRNHDDGGEGLPNP